MNSLLGKTVSVLLVMTLSTALGFAEELDLKKVLEQRTIPADLPLKEVQRFTESRVPRMPEVATAAEWEQIANKLRKQTLQHVVFRGEAEKWRTSKMKVEWLDTIEGGPGYRIRKLRYETLPGLWVPALLYEPNKLSGKVPVVLNVNGHDRGAGKAAEYKQIRCINQAKRGMIALNVEWLGMGQLSTPGFTHYRMNQLDLCGTSGLAPFYLTMSRGLDVLLALEHADPDRVAVAGLSGGGWQTIFISSLDTRVTLSNPVAGYSSFLTRARYFSDLGDSEQTPCDLARFVDYTHLTAMRAPRPTLLTFNAKDNCCFASPHALPPLLQASRPIYELYDQKNSLRFHVNHVPGNHNFGQENREALYQMLGDFFVEKKTDFNAREIESKSEVKTKDQLLVPLPKQNEDFHSLAMKLSESLPENAHLPKTAADALVWKKSSRKRLQELVRYTRYKVTDATLQQKSFEGTQVAYRQLKLDETWTLPAVEFTRGTPKRTVIVIADAGKRSLAKEVESLLAQGVRVLAVDLFYFGESKITQRDFLFGLLVSAVHERPLGIQASQLQAVAEWAKTTHQQPVSVQAFGPRHSLIALVSVALEETSPIEFLKLSDSYGSLKEILEQDIAVNQAPELFCFGMLKSFDIIHLTAMSSAKGVEFVKPSERVLKELKKYEAWKATIGD